MALRFGEGYLLLGVDKKFLDKELSGAKASFQKSLGSMQAISNKARIALAAGFGVGAIAVKITAGFEQGMARVRALTGAVGIEFTALGDTAKQLGRTTVFSARQAADAMGFFALAGFEANQILKAMPATLNLAAAGQLDVAQAADIAAKIMKGMGLSAEELEHATDVMAKAFTTANTDLIQLGEAFRYVGPVARSAGIDIKEITATIQVLSNAGIQGQMAGTALRRALTGLAQTKGPAADVFRTIGVETQTATGRLRPLADIIDDFAEKLSKLGEAQRIAVVMQAFGLRAGPAMAALISEGGQAIRDFQKDLENAGGTAKRIAEIQLDTLQGRLIKLKSAAEGLAITFGEKMMPVLKKLVDRVTAWTSSLASLNYEGIRQIGIVIEMTAKVLALTVAMTAVMKVTMMLLSTSGPLGLAITVLTATVVALAGVFVEAKMKGQTFFETLRDNVSHVRGMASELDILARNARRAAETMELLAQQEAQQAAARKRRTGEGQPAPGLFAGARRVLGFGGMQGRPPTTGEASASVALAKEMDKRAVELEKKLEDLREKRLQSRERLKEIRERLGKGGIGGAAVGLVQESEERAKLQALKYETASARMDLAAIELKRGPAREAAARTQAEAFGGRVAAELPGAVKGAGGLFQRGLGAYQRGVGAIPGLVKQGAEATPFFSPREVTPLQKALKKLPAAMGPLGAVAAAPSLVRGLLPDWRWKQMGEIVAEGAGAAGEVMKEVIAPKPAEGGVSGFTGLQDFWRQMQIGKESPADKKRNGLLEDIKTRLPKGENFWEEMKKKLGMFE